MLTLQPGFQVCPITWEPERLLARRLRCLRFQPAHWNCAPVEEPMHAAYTRPDIVPCLHMITLAVQDRFSLTAEQEIRFLERVVMHIALATRLELDHEQRQVLSPQHAIHEHFQGDTVDIAAPVAIHLQLAGRWHLLIVEMTKIARPLVP